MLYHATAKLHLHFGSALRLHGGRGVGGKTTPEFCMRILRSLLRVARHNAKEKIWNLLRIYNMVKIKKQDIWRIQTVCYQM
jgi:hypothetical protein